MKKQMHQDKIIEINFYCIFGLLYQILEKNQQLPGFCFLSSLTNSALEHKAENHTYFGRTIFSLSKNRMAQLKKKNQ